MIEPTITIRLVRANSRLKAAKISLPTVESLLTNKLKFYHVDLDDWASTRLLCSDIVPFRTIFLCLRRLK